jgi:hypothetical protein
VSADPPPDHLSTIRYVTLLVRLTIADDGRLLYGELLDLQGQSYGRIQDWSQLLPALQACAAVACLLESPKPPEPPAH